MRPKGIRVPEINLLAIIGGILVLIGLFVPWFSFLVYIIRTSLKLPRVYLSPFFISTHAAGKTEYLWFPINIGALAVGLICILGAFLGLLGGHINNRVSCAGGVMSLAATALFPSCLPGYYYNMKLELGGFITAMGSFLMIASALLKIGLPERTTLIRLEGAVLAFKSKSLKRKTWLSLKLLAIVGSIYSGYELSRIVHLTLARKSINLTIARHPTWVFWLEIALCLYASTYWFLRTALQTFKLLEMRSDSKSAEYFQIEIENKSSCKGCRFENICVGPWGIARKKCHVCP